MGSIPFPAQGVLYGGKSSPRNISQSKIPRQGVTRVRSQVHTFGRKELIPAQSVDPEDCREAVP